MTLTIELPESLIQQFNSRKIPENEIKAFTIAALEIWLAQPQSVSEGRFNGNAEPFARRLIAQNRELFEALAQL